MEPWDGLQDEFSDLAPHVPEIHQDPELNCVLVVVLVVVVT